MKHEPQNPRNLPFKQSGALLFVTLVLLVIVAFLGVSAVELSSTSLRLSSDSAQKTLSFQGAESLRLAAFDVADVMAATLGSAPASFALVAGQGRYNVGGPAPTVVAPAVKTHGFWNNPANYQLAPDGNSAYAIEYMGRKNLTPDANRATGDTVPVHVFRITVRSTTNSGVETTLQSTYVTNCAGAC